MQLMLTYLSVKMKFVLFLCVQIYLCNVCCACVYVCMYTCVYTQTQSVIISLVHLLSSFEYM